VCVCAFGFARALQALMLFYVLICACGSLNKQLKSFRIESLCNLCLSDVSSIDKKNVILPIS